MGENGRRLVGYRVRLASGEQLLYLTTQHGGGTTADPFAAQMFGTRSKAFAELEDSNSLWVAKAKVVAVYRSLKGSQ